MVPSFSTLPPLEGGCCAARPEPGEEAAGGLGVVVPADPAGDQIVAGVAEHGEVGVVGLEDASVQPADRDADDPRLGEPREAALALPQGVLRVLACGDVDVDAERANDAACVVVECGSFRGDPPQVTPAAQVAELDVELASLGDRRR